MADDEKNGLHGFNPFGLLFTPAGLLIAAIGVVIYAVVKGLWWLAQTVFGLGS